MESLQRMINSIEYIEEHITEQLDIGEIARNAYASTFHFQRMFHMLTGVTVTEYIRRRRMTLAAQELASSNCKVIDIALKYGYDTPESFAKAFRRMHGIAPSSARESGQRLIAYPRLSFQIYMKGDQEMNYSIMEKESFKVIGRGIRVSTVDGENLREIPLFWKEVNESGVSEQLRSMSADPLMFGICMDFSPNQEEFTYFIGVKPQHGEDPGTFIETEIPASTWAVFESVGAMPNAIQNVWKRIFSEWFPATAYEHAEGPELEVYPAGNPYDGQYRCEVWIPIIKH